MSEKLGLYEQVLAGLGENATLPERKAPRSSASVVLWRRDDGGEIEVFWVRRSESLAFMGGWYAFPGGTMTPGDLETPVDGWPQGVDEAPADAGMPESVTDGVGELGPIVVPGLLSCALRELFEESGLLAVRELESLEGEARSGLRESLAASRRSLLEGETDVTRILESQDWTLDASALFYAGRWLSPPLGPLRFDNRFFLLEWPAAKSPQPSILPGELDQGEWVRPRAALSRWERGELMAAPPILHILRVLAEDGVDEGKRRLWEPTEANLGPCRRIEFRPGVLLFPLLTPTLPPASFTNAYIVGFEKAVLIDPGSPYPKEIGRLKDAILALEDLDGRRLSAIWITHHHQDHVGGVEELRRELDIPVLAHRLTGERLEAAGIQIDGELEDGQRVVLGGEPPFSIRIVHTPGHARGHLCFLDETFGSLVAGDMVAGFGTIVIDPPEGNMSDYFSSLEMLLELAPRTIFPAHGPTIKNATAKLEEYLRHRRWREEKILQAWMEGMKEPREMLDRVYADVAVAARPLAERQILAHLERLRKTGRLG